MECKHIKEEDQWNEEAGFYQKLKTCALSKKICQGGADICSKFEAVEKPAEEKPKEMAEQDKERKEEEEKPEEKEEEEKPAE